MILVKTFVSQNTKCYQNCDKKNKEKDIRASAIKISNETNQKEAFQLDHKIKPSN